MITTVSISNLGPIAQLECGGLQHINLVVGKNQSGKTFLLKALFAAMKTVEQYRRGMENRTDREILSDKLYWTFQTTALGNIVSRRSEAMQFSMCADDGSAFAYTVGASATRLANVRQNTFAPRTSNTVFIPAKEILSIKDIILEARDDRRFGFEEPYSDLARALTRTQKGRNYDAFAQARRAVDDMVGGHLEYDEERKTWFFRDHNRMAYEVSATSEGVKKLAILDLLLGNRYLDPQSVIIIDEVEANLHPAYIDRLLQTIVMLAESGVQFFLSSHSYFVIKRLYILAHRRDISIPVLSFDDSQWQRGDLREAMPRNAIIDESVNVYREEISL